MRWNMQKSRSFERNLGYLYLCAPSTPPPLVTYFSTAVECFCVHMCVLPQFIAPNSKLMALDKAETHNSTLYLALVVRISDKITQHGVWGGFWELILTDRILNSEIRTNFLFRLNFNESIPIIILEYIQFMRWGNHPDRSVVTEIDHFTNCARAPV